jgi:DNA mismatch repair protein MutS
MEKLTPMLKQYMDVKKEYQDALVMFRLGDFYELFFEDAKIASYELDLVLTGRAAGEQGRAPMCGVPYHAVSSYIQKLVNNGHKVAIVEQMEDPALAVGLVRRDVVKVVTPGTVMDEIEDDKMVVSLASVTEFGSKYLIVSTELASGEMRSFTVLKNETRLKEALIKHQVKEVVLSSKASPLLLKILRETKETISICDQTEFDQSYASLCRDISDPVLIETFGRLLNYLLITQKRSLRHLQPIIDEDQDRCLSMDMSTLLNLELVESLRQGTKKESLFGFLDECQSACGSRNLKRWIIRPLLDLKKIETRQNQIEYLVINFLKREDCRSALKQTYDVERIIGKIAYGSAGPQDLLRLAKTLNQVEPIISTLDPLHFESYLKVDPLNDLKILLNKAIDDSAPSVLKDGNVFKKGYNDELDALRELQENSAAWLIDFENSEKERTQIKNLKVGYNRVFGYYIEISKGQTGLVRPEFEYHRKQTLSTGERYINPLLKQKEEDILGSNDKALRLQQRLFSELVEHLSAHLSQLQELSKALSDIDVIQALATLSQNGDYIKPRFHPDFELNIVEGRHPILETKTKYVPNSIHFTSDKPIHLLTGPNMGGKSTYMRQVALLVIMAQMGMYIPAKQADLPLIDAIYTRMGASDDILEGQSTFMVEMIEANSALQKASLNSLILFDEIGRGTSTYDGMALAQAMVEYIATVIQCKAIFSTHYHELTHLEETLPQLINTHVEVIEDKHEVHFLYRVKHGKAGQSYGVNVARLAHLPESVIDRAAILLKQLESKKRVVQQTLDIVEIVRVPKEAQLIIDSLNTLDINETTPIEALRYLNDYKEALKDNKHGKD